MPPKKMAKKPVKPIKKKINLNKFKSKDGKLNPLVKSLWLNALRSGKFTQCKSGLCEKIKGITKHCVLGVLIEILRKSGFPISRRIFPELKQLKNKCYEYLYCPNKDLESFWSGSGLAEDLLIFIGLDRLAHNRLIDMNDHDGKDFLALAIYIEDNL